MASWITDIFGGGKLVIEIAFGANPTADSSTWTWTDVTADVYDTPGISPSFGRQDEASASQPGKCMLRLDNRSGNYSKGGESANWPNVRIGTPARIRIDPDGGGLILAYWGQISSWRPGWDYHAVPYVAVEISGSLRRIGQGTAPLQSVFRRALSNDVHTAAYWPMEDGANSTYFSPAVGVPGMGWPPGQQPNLASNSTLDGSLALPTLNKALILGSIDPYNWSSQFSAVRMLADFPASGEPNGTFLAVWFNAAASPQLGNCFFTYNSATQAIDMAAYDFGGTLLGIQAGVAGAAVGPVRMSFEFIQFGSAVLVAWAVCAQGGSGSYSTFTSASLNVGRPWLVVLGDPVAGLTQIAVGHVVVQDGYNFDTGYTAQQSFISGYDHWAAFRGEYADNRIKRLAAENNTAIMVMGSSEAQMGSQQVDTLINLLRECEAADGGTLHDGNGVSPGLTYMARSWMESRTADLTLNAQGDVVPPFEPVDDDRYIRNQAVVTRTKGTTYTYQDVNDSYNGTSYVGIYQTSATVNLSQDADVRRYAEWIVGMGTYDQYRYSTVSIDLRKSKTLARSFLSLMPGNRIDATNLSSALTSFTGGTVSLQVLSISHQIKAREWVATMTCAPYAPWYVGQLNPNSDGSAITFLGIGTGVDAVSTQIQSGFEVPIPGQATPGDLLLIWATVRNSGTGTINVPTDWTALVTSGNCVLMGRFMRPNEPNPILSVNGAVANELAVCQSFALRGVYPDITACVHASASQLNGATTNTIAFPGLTITQPNCAVFVGTWKKDAWTGSSAISGLTKMFGDNDSSGNGASIGGDYKIETTASNLASGTKSITDATSSISRAVSIAFLPATTPIAPEVLDTPGSTLASSISAGATSMSVASTSASTISYVNIGTLASGNNASLTPALPASIATNDLMLMWATIRNTGATVSTPTGWTSLVTLANCTLFGKYVVPGETAPTVAFSGGSSGDTTIAQILALRGTGRVLSSVVHASATQANASAQNVAYPALTVTQDGCYILFFQWKQNAWTSKQFIAFEISDNGVATGSGASVGIDYLPQTTATNVTSGSDVVTGGSSAVSKAFVVAIKPHTSGALWTTDSGDYPMDLSVGGVKITASACSGTATPQTMTISAAPVARTSGVDVRLWSPPRLSR